MRLSPEQTDRLLTELALHEYFAVSAIAERHSVSRWTLWRLLDYMRAERELQHLVSDSPNTVR